MYTILLFLFLCQAHSEPTGLSIDDFKVKLTIDKFTTDTDLENFKKVLWDKRGITFEVDLLCRDDFGHIKTISIKVNCHDGQSGTASYNLDQGARIGFVRNYSEGADTSFAIGSVEGE